jgi:hypothetical protein
MAERVELNEIRLGGRNFVRVGDVVKVKPSRPGRRDGFDAVVKAMWESEYGVEVEVIGGPKNRPAATRTFRPERLERRSQAKVRRATA